MFKKTRVSRAASLACSSALALSATAAFPQQQLEKVEITGSSIKRIDAEQAVPVTVISRKEIERSGVTNTEQLLNAVTSTSFVGAYTTSEGAGTATYGLASVSLRGLGSQRTLVLVNGHRLANFAPDGTSVDVNSIPLSAVDRVEVLRDGASSTYGSDAVAGVVNFILRKNYNGLEASIYGGTPSRAGGGQQYKFGMVAGSGDLSVDSYNLMFSFDYAKERALYGSQRSNFAGYSWTEDGMYTQSATPGGALGGPWVVGVPGASQPTLNAVGNPLSPGNCAQNGAGYDPAYGTCRYNAAPLVDIIPDTERYSFGTNLTKQFGGTTTAFAEMFYTHAQIFTTQQSSPISAAFLLTDNKFAGSGVDQSLLLYPGNPNYPLAYLTSQGLDTTKPYAVSLRTFDNGRRVHVDQNDQFHLASGIDGSENNWDYNLTANYNSSKVSESTMDGYMSQLDLVNLLNNTPNWDPYVVNQSPSIAAAMRATNYDGPMLDSSLSNMGLDGKVNTTFGSLQGRPVALALGFGVRREKFDYQPSAAYQSGDISGYGGQQLPLSSGRTSSGLFSEIEAPLLKTLTGNISVRVDHYPNDTSTNPKASLRWQPTPSILLRGSYGTGFREASLPELYTPQVIGTTSTFKDPVKNTTGQYTLLTGGNPDLKPEKSKQASIGLVFEPSSGTSIGVDFFWIDLKDTIQNGGLSPAFIVQQAAAGNASYTPYVQRDASGNITQISSLNVNAGRTVVSGIDVDAKASIAKTSWGDVTAALNGTYIDKYDVTLPDGTVQHSVAATTDSDGNVLAIQNNSGGGIIMRWRHALTLAISNDLWGGSIVQNFQTGYGDNTNANGDLPARRVSSFTTYDVQGTLNPTKQLKLSLGVKNLFDRDPPFSYTNGNYFQVGWDPTYYDPRARFVYVNMNYKFF